MSQRSKLYSILKLTLSPLMKTWFRMEINGEENVPKKGAAIFASNHLSHIDSICLGAAIPRELYFLAKKEIETHWLVGYPTRMLNTLYVEREKPSKEALVKVLEHLKQDKPLLMYPAGTRAKDGGVGIIKPGVAWIASKAREKYDINSPIIPIAIKGTYKIHPAGWIPFYKKVKVNIGKKIEVKDRSRKELADIVKEEITKLFYL